MWQRRYVTNGYGGNSLGQWQAAVANVGVGYVQKRLIPKLLGKGKKKKKKVKASLALGQGPGFPVMPLLIGGGLLFLFITMRK